jgi:predicted metal-dependent HD superfamily phosphohydrolase
LKIEESCGLCRSRGDGQQEEPHRHYHTLQHLKECFEHCDHLANVMEHLGEIQLALWFHDAVYDLDRHDNEERSADWARNAVIEASCNEMIADRVMSLVLATRHAATGQTPDQRTLIDIDLWILGAPAKRFDEYERQVRSEYLSIPEALF